ncbi:MAG TPA: AI-2E family transporter [Terriglobia bacterium]|nr:AI-2E family transporter [Terriglobia bacterium]
MPETKLESTASPASTHSQRIIAIAIVFTCLYFASSLVISLIFSIFIASILEPGVRWMERFRLPRWMGSLVMVMATLAVMYLLVYIIYDRTLAFASDLPKYTERLKQIIAHVQVTFRNIRLSAASLLPTTPEIGPTNTLQVQQQEPWLQFLLRGLGSAYGFVTAVLFIPILVFFMLTSKNQMWVATMNLFPRERRHAAEDVINGITQMVREYVLGNLLVALISALVIWPIFAAIKLPYAMIMATLAALLSLVPYLGVAFGVIPPLLVALVHPDYNSTTPFVIIIVTVVMMHFIAINILTPKLVGRRVNLNPLTVTISMMFWGWMWGGIGLVLAVPITAAIKAVCDNVASLRPYGAWLGEE